MCYINGIRVTREEYIDYKKKKKLLKYSNGLRSGFDYSDFPIIKPGGIDWDLVNAHWEFIPSWIKTNEALKESRKKFTTLNATAEKILESKMFRQSALTKRCLVLSSGFVEWRHYQPEGAKKNIAYPYYITVSEIEEEYFFMAGIYNTYVDTETGDVKDCFAIVTTEANDLMQQIHNKKRRMPTILTKELSEEWLEPSLTEKRVKEIASFQYDSEEMFAYTIAKDFKIAEKQYVEVDYPELAPLL